MQEREEAFGEVGTNGLGSSKPDTTYGCRCCCEKCDVSPGVLEVLQFRNYLCLPTFLPEVSTKLVFFAILKIKIKIKKLIKPCPVKETQ